MKALPVVRAARGGLSGRRVQTIVIGLVLLVSTAASMLALACSSTPTSPFDHAFAGQHGARGHRDGRHEPVTPPNSPPPPG